jgi:hypothetical protein
VRRNKGLYEGSGSGRPSSSTLLMILGCGVVLVLLDHQILGGEIIASALVFWHKYFPR